MQLSEEEIVSVVARVLPGFDLLELLQPLEGGNLNHVWRLKGKNRNLIIKWAPPYIAANPDVPLSPERLHFEAEALRLFSKGNLLHSLCSDDIRPPILLHFEESKHLIIMEDVGRLPSVAEWIRGSGDASAGTLLGHFIGSLHKQTINHKNLQKEFNNRDIQQTRLSLQYNPAADYLSKTGLGDVDSNLVSQKTKVLGQKLLESGKCLVMGDLWPASVLVNEDKLRLIDWEFAHYGRPLQDLGHFAAHCWMLVHTSSLKKERDRFKKLWSNFWHEYKEVLGPVFDEIITDLEINDTATHIGAEILVRTTGPFKNGYVYQSFEANHPLIHEAGQKAQQLILNDDFSELWT